MGATAKCGANAGAAGESEIIRTAVEELLRFESPIQYTARIVKDEAEICGTRLRRGQTILCMLGAANRDAHQFKEPDQLESETSEQRASGIWSGRAFQHRKPTSPAGRAGGNFADGATVSGDESDKAATKLGSKFWVPRIENPSCGVVICGCIRSNFNGYRPVRIASQSAH